LSLRKIVNAAKFDGEFEPGSNFDANASGTIGITKSAIRESEGRACAGHQRFVLPPRR